MQNSPSIKTWVEKARGKIKGAGVTEADLDELLALAAAPQRFKQRLLYLTAQGMNPYAPVLAATSVDPVEPPIGHRLEPQPKMPYNSVFDAMADGWRIVSFPDANRESEDRELGVYGYLFILEKMEPCRD